MSPRARLIADAHQLALLIPATASDTLRRALVRSVLLGLRAALW